MCDSKQCLILIHLPSPAPGDYTSIDMMLTFDGGNIQITVQVEIVDDNDPDDPEEFSLHLELENGINVTVHPDEATFQILDDGK